MDKYDVIIFGAGLSGLVAAYTLSNFGIKCCILEKSNNIGGGNASFKNDLGDIFDFGYHALDESRSKITSSLFKKVMPDFYSHKLRRAIVLDGNIIKYNSNVESWPTDLSNKIKLKKVDDITGEVTADKLASVYGSEFIQFCKHSIFKSYPSEVRSQKEGRSQSRMFDLIYPWFFPKLDKLSKGDSESTRYHNKMRDSQQNIIYPKYSGFSGFIEGLYNAINKDYCDLVLGCKDLNILFNDELQCQGINVGGKQYISDYYFWCAPFFGLASLYGIDLPKGTPQKLVLGSFRFDYELSSDFHELLVGDCNHKINRISFPGLLRNDVNNLLQVEFVFPDNEFSDGAKFWEDQWLESLLDLGIIRNKKYIDFNFRVEYRGMVTSEPLDEIAIDYDKKINNIEGNIFIPFCNVGPENINRLVPAVIENTISFISKKGI